jgi:hypothetical protein
MLTQQPKSQSQSEHEWEKRTHTNYKDKAIYNIWFNDDGDNNINKNQSYQLEVMMVMIIQFFIYLRADSTAIGHLQSQHEHIQ